MKTVQLISTSLERGWQLVPHSEVNAGQTEERRSLPVSLTAARAAVQVCAKGNGLDQESRRDLSPELAACIQSKYCWEDSSGGTGPCHSERVIYFHICSLFH